MQAYLFWKRNLDLLCACGVTESAVRFVPCGYMKAAVLPDFTFATTTWSLFVCYTVLWIWDVADLFLLNMTGW